MQDNNRNYMLFNLIWLVIQMCWDRCTDRQTDRQADIVLFCARVIFDSVTPVFVEQCWQVLVTGVRHRIQSVKQQVSRWLDSHFTAKQGFWLTHNLTTLTLHGWRGMMWCSQAGHAPGLTLFVTILRKKGRNKNEGKIKTESSVIYISEWDYIRKHCVRVHGDSNCSLVICSLHCNQ